MAFPLAAVRSRPVPEAGPDLTDRRRPTVVSAKTPALPKVGDRTMLGVAALLLSTLLFPLSDMMSKTLAEATSGLEVAWMRSVVLLIAILPIILRRPELAKARQPFVQVARGLASTVATALALIGFTVLPVADATAVGFCAPVIVTVLAATVLKERIGPERWAAAAIGFGGILVIVQPGPGTFQAATLFPLCSSLFAAATVVTTRLGRGEHAETTVLWTALIGLAVLSLAVIPGWTPIDAHTAGLGLVMGVLAAAASVLQIVAYRCAPSSLLAPFSYAQILCAIGLGWLVFGTVPGPAMLAGSAVVIASGCAVALGSRTRKRDWTTVRNDLAALDPARRLA